MHLVFVTSIVPDGSSASGYEIANQAILDGFQRAGARVTALGFAWPGKTSSVCDDAVVLGEVDVRTDSASAVQKLQWLAKAVRTGKTFASVKLAALPERAIRAAIESIGPFDAYIVNAVQEEIGLRGAEMIARRIKPNVAIITDVTHDTSTPMINKMIEGDVQCGKGPSLAYAPAVHNKLLSFVEKVAADKKIAVQWRALSRSTGTDTDSFAYSNDGCP